MSSLPNSAGAGGARNVLNMLARPLTILLRAEDAVPIALVAAITFGGLLWNVHAGLVWTTPGPFILVSIIALVFLGMGTIFSTVFSNRIIAELAIYLALWAVFPIFGIRLSYLAATLDLPLQDALFARLDALLGFDWRTTASILWSNPLFIDVLIWSYRSNLVQPLILVCAFALFGPRGRNRELLTAMIFASVATVAVFAVLPSFGPNEIYGIDSGWHTVLGQLRAGTHAVLPYVGIVSFPSYHASMAIILTAAVRNNRAAFIVSSIVNGLMIVATVPIGYHYLIDVIAGILIAFAALAAAWRLEERRNRGAYPAENDL